MKPVHVRCLHIILTDVTLYCYWQVLFHSLPVMLERCVDYKLASCGAEPIVIDQAVDFLQALLDLLTNVHVHLEVSARDKITCLASHQQYNMCFSHVFGMCGFSFVVVAISGCKYVGWRLIQL